MPIPAGPVVALPDDQQRLLDATGPAGQLDDGSLFAWLAGPAEILQVLDDLCRDSPSGPGWSVVLDVNRCPTYALPWLAQFVGVRLDLSQTDDQQRKAIVAEQGFTRGTPAALVKVAQQYLGGTKTVVLVERDTGAYHFSVTVYSAELLGLSYAQLSATYATYSALTTAFTTYSAYSSSLTQLIAALTAAKPAGLQMTVTITNGSPPS